MCPSKPVTVDKKRVTICVMERPATEPSSSTGAGNGIHPQTISSKKVVSVVSLIIFWQQSKGTRTTRAFHLESSIDRILGRRHFSVKKSCNQQKHAFSRVAFISPSTPLWTAKRCRFLFGFLFQVRVFKWDDKKLQFPSRVKSGHLREARI